MLGGGAIPMWASPAQSAGASAAEHPQAPWAAKIAARRQQLIAQNGTGTDAALRTELLSLREKDQEARGFKNGAPAGAGQPAMANNLAAIDAALTEQLKTIVEQKGWPTIALVGSEASDAATLLLNHSADHAWQRELLPRLATLADEGKIDGSNLAGVIDKELVSEGKPQRYGTQFKFVSGEMAMYAVENPGELDALRARTMLPPMDVYKDLMVRIYHLKMSNRIVSPQAATTVAK